MTFEMIDPPKAVEPFTAALDFARLEPSEPKEQQHYLNLTVAWEPITDSSYFDWRLLCKVEGHDHETEPFSKSRCDAHAVYDTYNMDEFFERYAFATGPEDRVEVRSGLITTWWEGHYDDAEIRWRYVEDKVKTDG